MNTIATSSNERCERIRRLNDLFRRTFVGGRVVVTQSIAALPACRLVELLVAVRQFDAFSTSNDPWLEHDMGAVVVGGQRYLFKIDCFDLSCTAHSPDAADASVTIRVLTIMRADEY